MKLDDFDYNLPKDLIATEPIRPRDHSWLLVFNKKSGEIEHKRFYNVIDYFQKGDVLVMNNSKVFPARLIGKKVESGGMVEVFLHKKEKSKIWNCILGGRNLKTGLKIEFKKELICEIVKNNNDGTWQIEFNKSGDEFMKTVEKIGNVPLPPYIGKQRKEKVKNDKKNYQTVYADNSKIGSVAAPTAGLHFTKTLIKKLEKKGVEILYITLHVGLGTFSPVKTENIKKHKMHAEWVEIKSSVIAKLKKAKKEQRKIITVGTTSTRSLEAVFSKKNIPNKFSSWVDIFIYPGYKFKAIDGMITNFHLPKSSLIMLVSALAGKKNIDKAYKEAIKRKYRFYSYGDAMLII